MAKCCLWCRKKATKLCDTLLVYRENPEAQRGLEIITCDALLCDDHATTTPTTLCTEGGACETIDRCPFCKDEIDCGRNQRLNAVDMIAFGQHRDAHVVASKRAAIHAIRTP